MRRVLVILTGPSEPLDEKLMRCEQSLPDTVVERIDLTTEKPDYEQLLESIFAADSVQVW